MIAGLLKDASISFVADEWLMGGFSMYADKPYTATEAVSEQKFLM
jgi:hypothetical protein